MINNRILFRTRFDTYNNNNAILINRFDIKLRTFSLRYFSLDYQRVGFVPRSLPSM